MFHQQSLVLGSVIVVRPFRINLGSWKVHSGQMYDFFSQEKTSKWKLLFHENLAWGSLSPISPNSRTLMKKLQRGRQREGIFVFALGGNLKILSNTSAKGLLVRPTWHSWDPTSGGQLEAVPPPQEGTDDKPQPTSPTLIAARRGKSSPGPRVPLRWHRCHRPRGCPSMLPRRWAHHGDTLSPKRRGAGSLPGSAPRSAPQQHQDKPIKPQKRGGQWGKAPAIGVTLCL